MQKEKLIRIDLVLRPSNEALREVISLSRELGDKYQSEFVLDDKNFFPHITVYAPVFPEKNINKIIEETRKLAKNFNPIEMKYYKITANQGWLGIEFECTGEIKLFHKTVIDRTNFLREGYNLPEFENADNLAKLSPEKTDCIKKYGVPNSGLFYHPHLTITRLKDSEEAQGLISNVIWNIPSFYSDTIAIYKMGEHGTCIELVEEFKLGKK